ncbi:MAG: hypothetical protein AB7T49_17045 [Oligoflexales bacterium]
MRFIYCLFLTLFGLSQTALSQDEKEVERFNVLEDDFWVTSQANALGGATSTNGQFMDAAYYNPAGLAGYSLTQKAGTVKMVNFPYVGFSAGENSANLSPNFDNVEEEGNPILSTALHEATTGKQQYTRYSIVPSFNIGSFVATYTADTQLFVSPTGTENVYTTHFRSKSGPGIGWSSHDNQNRLYLGVFAAKLDYTTISEDHTFTDIEDPVERKDFFTGTTKYQATHINVGATWIIPSKKAPSTIALVFRNAGGTKLKAADSDVEDITIKEDATLGYQIAPHLGHYGHMAFMLDFERLGQYDITFTKKIKTGLEFGFGRTNENRPIFAIRTGYNYSGLSYGAGFNLGILGIDYAAYKVDERVGNIIDDKGRSSAVVTIDVGRL